jgi:hypothetical protein
MRAIATRNSSGTHPAEKSDSSTLKHSQANRESCVWSSEDIRTKSDLGARLPKEWKIYLYHGSEDDVAPFGHVDLYEKAIPQAVIRRLAGRDHQLNEDLSEVAADIRRFE